MAKKETIEALTKALEGGKKRNFPESVDIAINIKDVDLSIPKNRIDAEILLPKGRGKDVKIAIFGSGELAVQAKKVADTVIEPDMLEEISGDKKEARKMVRTHEFFIAEAPLMPTIGKKMGIFLGPKGKMPRPIPPQADPAPMVKTLKNTVRVRSKDRRTFHTVIGSREMSIEDLAENLEAVMKRVESSLERGSFNIQSVYVKSSMGPAVQVR